MSSWEHSSLLIATLWIMTNCMLMHVINLYAYHMLHLMKYPHKLAHQHICIKDISWLHIINELHVNKSHIIASHYAYHIHHEYSTLNTYHHVVNEYVNIPRHNIIMPMHIIIIISIHHHYCNNYLNMNHMCMITPHTIISWNTINMKTSQYLSNIE